jgi:hypothetical protein
LQVCLQWQSLSPAPLDYQVFVHLLGEGGDQVAQADFQPKDGLYPTSLWLPGETISDCVVLDTPGLPQDGWQIAVGLYDLATGQRPSVTDARGQSIENNMVMVEP